ncbi:MAG: hypothetical protein U5O16_02900 [Rhodococcus sp. (in: high G+C Gram-positive bacteria)]|uniref:hypothetical protein n=1 Tax=Rhodococcus sp. TaxID=1831 RepID=UPI002AD724A2|nr:hypothetical protein [Rhodococcus sp. (in: high G+C Gram-positive bacteria)]
MTHTQNTPPDNATDSKIADFWDTHQAAQTADDDLILQTADDAHEELVKDVRSGLVVLVVAFLLGAAFGIICWLALVTA